MMPHASIPDPEPEPSLAELAFQSLRQTLRDGGISPDRLYTEVEFAELLGISRTPVREALKALVNDGVMTSVPKRGYHLRRFSESEIDEMFALREKIESLVMTTLANDPNKQKLARLKEVLDRQSADISGETIFALDEQFHLIAAEAAGLHRTRKMLEGLRSATAAIAAGVTIGEFATRQRIGEHQAIFEAIQASNSDLAVRLMTEHIHASRQSYMQSIAEAEAARPTMKRLR